MGQDNVRMGKGAGGRRWLLLILGLAIAGVVAVVVLALLPEDESAVERKSGCATDADCRPGTSCIGHGCIILLSSESPDLWRDDLGIQLDPAQPWKPRSKFGVKMTGADRCPAPTGKGIKPDESQITRVLKVTAYEVGVDGLRIHQQVKAKGDLWTDSLRLWFPMLESIEPAQVCTSPEVDSIAVGKGRWRGVEARRVDLRLRRAVPAGTVTGAAIKVDGPLPAASEDGIRTLEIGLDPVFEPDSAEHTVVAVPLGTDVTTIDGPPPVDQRLLTGWIAYYWEHGKAASELAIRFRVPARARRALPLEELNP